MRQIFYLVNLDKRWVVKSSGTLGERFCSEGLHLYINHFTIPAWSEKSKALLCFRYPRILHLSKSPSKLLRLPQELLSMLFDFFDILDDAACLCMVDGRLFRAGFARLVQLQKDVYANWAGHRIICLGEHTSDDDYPASMKQLVKDELERWPPLSPKDEKAFFGAVADHYVNFKPGMVSQRRIGNKNLEIADDESDVFLELLTPRYDSEQPWVLCNLSKGKYVRADAVAALTDSDGGTPFIPGMHAMTLDHVALFRICWSSSEWIALYSVDELHRGIWAGDRFEVTSLDKIDAAVEWEDVSEEVVEALDEIWRTNRGEDWKERAKKRQRSRWY